MPDDMPAPAIEAPQPAPPKRPNLAGVWLREIISTLLPALLIAIFINLFLAQSTYVQGQSMEANLHDRQRLVIEKITYRFHGPGRGDIVVLKREEWEGPPLIKRVIGLAGEQVAIHDGQVFIDGKPLDEPYLDQVTPGEFAPVRVPPLYVYVLGDNRMASRDSRVFGPVPLDSLRGRAWLSYWPLNTLGFVH